GGLVECHLELDAGGKALLNFGKFSPDGVSYVDDVCLGLPDHADSYRRRAVAPQRASLVFGAQLDPTEILQLDQLTALAGHNQIGNRGGRLDLPQRANGESPPLGLDPARRHFDVSGPNGLLHVLDSETPGSQLGS